MLDFLGTALVNALLSLPLIGIYLLFAVGVVVIYRASRVLNLAHGALAVVPAYLFYCLGKPAPLLEWPVYVMIRLPLPQPLVLPVAGLLAIALGAAMGVATEAWVVRRLRRHGPVAQTVGTVAVYGLLIALMVKRFGGAPLLPPRLFTTDRIPLGSGSLPISALWVFGVGVAVTAACLALFRYTDLGLAMRAAADNRRAASLMGVDPDRTTSVAWALGGALAGLAGVLAGTTGNVDAVTLGLQVLPAFVGALIGGLEVLTGALIGCVIVALVQSEVYTVALLPLVGGLARAVGAPQLVLMVVAFVMLATRGQKFVAGAVRDAGLGGATARRVKPFSRSRERRSAVVAAVLVIAAAVLPILSVLGWVPFSVVGDGVLAGYYLLVALSVVLLTGWVGQISLAQAELVGIGALVTALVTNRFHLVFPLSLVVGALAAGLAAVALGAVALRVRGLYLAIATLVFAWMGDAFLFHQKALGVSGGTVSANFPNLGDPRAIPYFDFTNPVLIYVIVFAVAIWAVYCVANLADSKTGRAFFALRGSEVAAASLGIDVTRYKLLAFGVSGIIAGIAGSLIMIYQDSVEPSQFDLLTSLFFLGVAVVGGVESIGGAILAAIFFALLNAAITQFQLFSGLLEVVSAVLLLAVLLLYPGGLASLASLLGELIEQGTGWAWARTREWAEPALRALREWSRRSGREEVLAPAYAGGSPRTFTPIEEDGEAPRPTLVQRLSGWLPRVGPLAARPERQVEMADTLVRLRAEPVATLERPEPRLEDAVIVAGAVGDAAAVEGTEEAAGPRLEIKVSRRPESRVRPDQPVVLAARNVVVQFGGLTAVNDATLEVRQGEIVGLIGPNGAGKTTLFNAISGLNSPTQGRIEIQGVDATALDVHRRAALGVGRTFQQIQLFPQLTVFENLLVATHLRNGSGFFGHALALPSAIWSEVSMRARVDQVIDFLALGDLALRGTGDLPFGNLRIVELARALVTGSELLLLDEPASGLDNTESARFAELLLYCREKLGLSMLLIEHDIATVTGVSDFMYVLEQGRMIAEGPPSAVQRNQKVIEAYLGQPATEAGPDAMAWAGVEEEAAPGRPQP